MSSFPETVRAVCLPVGTEPFFSDLHVAVPELAVCQMKPFCLSDQVLQLGIDEHTILDGMQTIGSGYLAKDTRVT